ncbi:transmembrane protein 51a [Salarias fasciatus]|uniref:Transmembrane protein 51-like n=1 Tax=Salarias fasciatus TaxID=181472 RepID=A0A672IKC7_SALFA|nr:transmembrane protein 51-like [Salarias fasciatus]XP_029973954.1 transmembrane protein 51-like [Salarias fasciatus]
MRSSVDNSPASAGSSANHNNNNNNNINSNSNSNENSGNSGSQYALCALGVGLIALGIVMIVWSVVPVEAAHNSSTSDEPDDTGNRKDKASSVAFILTGSGVAMLMLSLCLGMRNKQREQQRLQESQNQRGETRQQDDRQSAEEQAQRYAVPSYEEAVGSGQYPVRQSNPRPSTSQLPSYDDLVQVDGVHFENEGPEVVTTTSQPAAAAVSASNRRPGKNSRKLLPIKIRRIKSEKLHVNNVDNSQPAPGISIEPLTPPPQYEDKVPPL